MTDYFIRPDGSDSNSGTSYGAGSAWQTTQKAVGASGISSGDRVFVAPGVYREIVTVSLTNPTSETSIIGDTLCEHFPGLSPGKVELTAYTTNDTTAPSASNL